MSKADGHAELQASDTIAVALNYARYDGPEGGSFYYVYPPEDGKPQTNIETTPVDSTLHDLRGSEPDGRADLDVHGFQYVKAGPSEEREFASEESVASGSYYAQVEELLRKHLTFDRLSLFDNTIRRQSSKPEAPGNRAPVPKVHVDQSESAAERRVRLHMPEHADEILKSGQRVRIVNIWRPISDGPVLDKPLAFADYRTIEADRDFFPSARIAPERTGQTLGVRHNDSHRWYYLSAMTKDEVALIKCYDSKPGVAKYTPHTAFDLKPDGDFIPRASIENIPFTTRTGVWIPEVLNQPTAIQSVSQLGTVTTSADATVSTTVVIGYGRGANAQASVTATFNAQTFTVNSYGGGGQGPQAAAGGSYTLACTIGGPQQQPGVPANQQLNNGEALCTGNDPQIQANEQASTYSEYTYAFTNINVVLVSADSTTAAAATTTSSSSSSSSSGSSASGSSGSTTAASSSSSSIGTSQTKSQNVFTGAGQSIDVLSQWSGITLLVTALLSIALLL